MLDLADPEPACRGFFSEDFLELVTGEVKPKDLGEVDGGRVERGGEGTERGLGEEQRERGRCWGEEEGSNLGGLGEAVLERAFGDVVSAMGEEDGEDSLRGCVRSAKGFELAARPVDWITLKCCCGASVRDLELCRASGEVWDGAGGEAEQGKGTRVGGLVGTVFSWSSAESGLSVLVDPVLVIKDWGGDEKC